MEMVLLHQSASWSGDDLRHCTLFRLTTTCKRGINRLFRARETIRSHWDHPLRSLHCMSPVRTSWGYLFLFDSNLGSSTTSLRTFWRLSPSSIPNSWPQDEALKQTPAPTPQLVSQIQVLALDQAILTPKCTQARITMGRIEIPLG